ncbi:MAG: ribonuclease P Rpr2/Rpp21/SNM1 subunit [Acidilobaceae archaeon]
MKKRPSKVRRLLRDLVCQRAKIILSQAVEAARRGDYARARELGVYAVTLAMRAGVRLPRGLKRAICKNCRAPLIPGLTCTVRARSQSRRFSYLVVRCKLCGYIHRRPYKRYQRALE